MDRSNTVVGIQYLRGLAALFVAIDHCSGMMAFPEYFGATPSDRLAYGYIGVPIFFVISGFIISVVSLREDLTSRVSAIEFVRKRVLRIVPFMWLCIILYAAIRFVGTGQGFEKETWKAFVLWPLGELRPNVLWTLRHEALFYTLFGLTVLSSWGRLPWLIAWFLSPAAVWGLDQLFPAWTSGMSEPLIEIIRLVFNPVNAQFGAGFALGSVYLKGSTLVRPRLNVGAFGVLLAASTMFAVAAALRLDKVGFEYLAVGVLATVLVWFALHAKPQPKSALARFLSMLGDASYSIYLVHNLTLLVGLTLITKLAPGVNLWAAEGTLVVAAVASGVAMHFAVERPLLKLLQRKAGDALR